MAGNPGFKKVLRVSSVDPASGGFLASNWKQVPSKDVSMSFGADQLDDTNMKDNVGGWRSFVLGLEQWSINGTIVAQPGDANIALIRNSMLNRSDLWVQYLPNGTANLGDGFQGLVRVSTFDDSGSVDDLQMISFTLQGSGELSTAS